SSTRGGIFRQRGREREGGRERERERESVSYSSEDPQKSCESCAEDPDTSLWVLVEPEIYTEKSVSTYSLSSPAGRHECSESGLRWSCAGPVTLQYRFTDWHVYAEELAH